MKIGLNYAFGASPAHDVAFLKDLVQTMEALGFASLWMPEHVVGFPAGSYTSSYPYSNDGAVPWQGDLSLHDPLLVAAAAAQMTRSLSFATGIVILPQRPPLLTAKELLTLDHLSGGRLEFGVGGGWSAEEYTALGVPFENRGKRFDEYIEAIRIAWRDNPASFIGEFVRYENVVLLPKPLTPGGPPFLIGGGSPAAFRRAARLGDGWFGHWTERSEPEAEINALNDELARQGRADDDGFRIKVGITHFDEPDALASKLQRAKSLGVHESTLIVPVRSKTLTADLELWAQAAGLLG